MFSRFVGEMVAGGTGETTDPGTELESRELTGTTFDTTISDGDSLGRNSSVDLGRLEVKTG